MNFAVLDRAFGEDRDAPPDTAVAARTRQLIFTEQPQSKVIRDDRTKIAFFVAPVELETRTGNR